MPCYEIPYSESTSHVNGVMYFKIKFLIKMGISVPTNNTSNGSSEAHLEVCVVTSARTSGFYFIFFGKSSEQNTSGFKELSVGDLNALGLEGVDFTTVSWCFSLKCQKERQQRIKELLTRSSLKTPVSTIVFTTDFVFTQIHI